MEVDPCGGAPNDPKDPEEEVDPNDPVEEEEDDEEGIPKLDEESDFLPPPPSLEKGLLKGFFFSFLSWVCEPGAKLDIGLVDEEVVPAPDPPKGDGCVLPPLPNDEPDMDEPKDVEPKPD